ncbi:uncharacterized protein Tco025E_05971 [Trypanosoma conorhini]|uniref:C2H2-type domain-containing protein n=1 Tax=Trypanosoma conorhini TaxID=83891 RepID=A0A3R7P7K6_9TRYP|nr:uncharacterized protein Tco025E_05971 [Trypanosoma conorhini]RNF13995.1 hypothetical protein Tco025E_05971 [Trypanosoma conorhini]
MDFACLPPCFALHALYSWDTTVKSKDSCMSVSRRFSLDVPSRAPTPVRTPARSQPRRASTPESRTGEWILRRHSSVRSRRSSTENGRPSASSLQTPRRLDRDSQASLDQSELAQRRASLFGGRCRHCYHFVAQGETTEHDRYCPLKPLACQQTDPRTGTACGYICRGRTMLLDHEARCHASNSRRPTPSKERPESVNRQHASGFYFNSDAAGPLLCRFCGAKFDYSAALARHKVLCLEVEVPCPLKCGKMFRRGDVAKHLQQQALEHKPMHVPDLATCAGDDPRIALALVLNLLLQKASGAGKSDLNTPAEDGTAPSQRKKAEGTPPSTLGPGGASAAARSSATSLLASPNTTAKVPSSTLVPRRGSGTHPKPTHILPGRAQKTGLINPEPAAPNENGSSRINEPITKPPRATELLIPAEKASPNAPPTSASAEDTAGSSVKRPPEGKGGQKSPPPGGEDHELDEALRDIDQQQKSIDRLKARYEARHQKDMSDEEQKRLLGEIQKTAGAIETRIKKLHKQVMEYVDRDEANPSSVIQMLGSWRLLERNWYDVKFAVYDHAMSCYA